MSDIKTVGVAGAGTMGRGIAETFAVKGFNVLLADQDLKTAGEGLKNIDKSLERALAKGKTTAEEKAATLARVKPVESLREFAACDFVVEAVFEDFGVKSAAFRTFDSVCRDEVILATNTSSLPITRIAAVTRRADRVIGMHFMNPVPVMKLVEIISGHKTSAATLATTLGLAEKLGKTPVAVQDYPGFVANRVLMPMINEAIFALWEGVGTVEAIDTVMKLGTNQPMGPLELADFIGLDVCLAIMNVLHEGYGDSKYRPCPLLRKMVDAGELGRKSGKGFHSYAK